MTLTVKDVMARFGVEQHTVLHWIHSGQIKAINVGLDPGKKKPRWRITQEAVAAFELSRMPDPPQQPKARRRKRKPSDVIEFIK